MHISKNMCFVSVVERRQHLILQRFGLFLQSFYLRLLTENDFVFFIQFALLIVKEVILCTELAVKLLQHGFHCISCRKKHTDINRCRFIFIFK